MASQPRQGKLKDIGNLRSSQDKGIAAAKKSNLDDPSVDIGALMRKALQAPKARSARRSPSDGDSQKQAETNTEIRNSRVRFPEDDNLQNNPSTPGKKQPKSEQQDNPTSSTPSALPNDTAAIEDKDGIPLAAKTLMKAHNRRKSVFQRPSRYGEWFDGDDEELERMVDEEDDAVQQNQPANKPADDIASKVREITNGLCEKLDDLIEESPAVKPVHPDKSLRDKLLESWEGRSYYERLMQMAGINNEKEDQIRAQLQKGTSDDPPSASDSAEKKNETSHAFLSPPKRPRLRVDIDSLPPPEMAPKALSTTAVRKAVAIALNDRPTAAAVKSTNATGTNTSTSTGTARRDLVRTSSDTGRLLKVSSARGPKPAIPAPWQATSPKQQQQQKTVRISEPDPLSKKSGGSMESLKADSIESLKSQLRTMASAKLAAETEVAHMKMKLKHAQERVLVEAEGRKAAEKRIALLEAKLQSLGIDSTRNGGVIEGTSEREGSAGNEIGGIKRKARSRRS